MELIKDKKYDSVLEHIDLNKHVSLSFEFLSQELLRKILSDEDIVQSGSFWTIDSEIDLFFKTIDGKIILGECKYKNTKICKSVLNSLQKKAKRLGLDVWRFALFSKSGFSNELTSIDNEGIMLFSLQDFKKLY